MMSCWHCGHELIWNADHDISDEYEEYAILTNLHCPNCQSEVEVYYPKEDTKKEGA